MIAVGIAIGKRRHQACFLDERGHELGRSLRFANSSGGVASLVERLQALGGLPCAGCQSAADHGLRSTGVRKTQTDRRDAFILAALVRIGRARPNYVPNDTVLQLRKRVSSRRDLKGRIGDAKRQAGGAGPRLHGVR